MGGLRGILCVAAAAAAIAGVGLWTGDDQDSAVTADIR
jgi:hypothetical protein